MSHDLGLVNHKSLNGTGKVTSHDFHHVNQSKHRWHKERHTNYSRCAPDAWMPQERPLRYPCEQENGWAWELVWISWRR